LKSLHNDFIKSFIIICKQRTGKNLGRHLWAFLVILGRHPRSSSSVFILGRHPRSSSSGVILGRHPRASSSVVILGRHPRSSSSVVILGLLLVIIGLLFVIFGLLLVILCRLRIQRHFFLSIPDYTMKTSNTIFDIIVLVVIVILTVCFFVYIGIDGVNRTPQRILYADEHGNVQPVLGLFRLSPYVARKIYDLAVISNEHCTITHEAFRIGDVAVMPCGHLYSKTALQTYFFTTTNDKICLICKKHGSPVYL
jgi:hypothetical protein